MALSKILENSIADGSVAAAKLKDFSAAVDLNGVELILDANQDTSITADTDDRIDLKIGGAEHISFSADASANTVIKPMADAKNIVFQQYDGNKILEINDGNYVAISGAAAGPGELRFYEDTDLGTNYTGFKAGNLTASVAYTLPLADGTSGQALTTNSSGVLSWTTMSANTPSSADGQALGSATLEWSDLFLADASTIQFGADQDVTLTHVADTGLLLNSTMKLQFNDASQFIHAPSATVLDIAATDEIELTATLIDVVGNLTVSGTIVSTGTITGTLATAAQANITSVGTLTALTVDDVAVDGKVITMTGSTDDTFTTTVGTNGATSLVTVDTAAAAAHLTITADGTVDINSAGVLTLDSGAAINIEPAAGSAILLDGTISIDAGVVTGATSITSTAFVGALTGAASSNLLKAGGTMTGDTLHGDNVSAKFGTGNDLIINHDGSNSYIEEGGTGNLILKATSLTMQSGANEKYIDCVADGAVDLYHNNTIQLKTTSTGLQLGNSSASPVLNSVHSLFFNIDSDNDSTGQQISFRKDATTYNGGTELLRIKENGQIQFGDYDGGTGARLAINSTADGEGGLYLRLLSAADANSIQIQFSDQAEGNCGTITTNASANTTAYNTSSDYRLKENVAAMSNQITRLKNLKPYTWDWKKAENSGGGEGFIAHELNAVVPLAVVGEKDAMQSEVLYVEGDDLPEGKSVGDVKRAEMPAYQGVDYSKLVPVLTGALQEAIAKIETLETKVQALEDA